MGRPDIEYIMHPISGDIPGNVRDVKRIMAERHTPDNIPFAPYLTALEYLDDSDPGQRALGMEANREFFEIHTITRVRATGSRVSEGMKSEIALAYDLAIPVSAEPHLEAEVADLLPFHMAYLGQRPLPNGETLIAVLDVQGGDLVVYSAIHAPANKEEYDAGNRGVAGAWDECYGMNWADYRDREHLMDTILELWTNKEPFRSLNAK